MTDAGFRAMRGGVDLNDASRFGQSSELLPGACHEHRQDPVRPAHGLPAVVQGRQEQIEPDGQIGGNKAVENGSQGQRGKLLGFHSVGEPPNSMMQGSC